MTLCRAQSCLSDTVSDMCIFVCILCVVFCIMSDLICESNKIFYYSSKFIIKTLITIIINYCQCQFVIATSHIKLANFSY